MFTEPFSSNSRGIRTEQRDTSLLRICEEWLKKKYKFLAGGWGDAGIYHHLGRHSYFAYHD
jgi:hypothetical protein